MAKIAYTNKVSIIDNSVPAINQWKAEDANEVKTSVNYLYDRYGWERYFDTLNTVSNKQSLTASQDNIITIDGVTSILTQRPITSPVVPLWASNKIRAIKSGDAYIIRFDFAASISNSNGWFEFALNVGGSIGKVLINTFTLPKGSNVTHNYSLTAVIYTADTFLANGANLIITPSHTMQIWDKSIYIQRTFDAR
jgi:hypothetical protein